MSWLCMGIAYHERMEADRNYAANNFKSLLALMFASIGDQSFAIQGLGCRNKTTVTVDCAGHISPTSLISKEWAIRLDDLWYICRASDRFPWVTGTLNNAPIWEFTMFCISPFIIRKLKQFGGELQSFGLTLFGYITSVRPRPATNGQPAKPEGCFCRTESA